MSTNMTTLDQLLDELDSRLAKVPTIGYGSQTRNLHAGWAICLVDRIDGDRRFFSGCVNAGTVAWAEGADALYVLRWNYENHRRSIHSGPIEAVITTDNQASRNLDVRAGFDFFKSVNYHLNWKWVERNKSPLHVAVDKLSKNCRYHADGCALIDPYKLLP